MPIRLVKERIGRKALASLGRYREVEGSKNPLFKKEASPRKEAEAFQMKRESGNPSWPIHPQI
jgi:hypothetical protein